MVLVYIAGIVGLGVAGLLSGIVVTATVKGISRAFKSRASRREAKKIEREQRRKVKQKNKAQKAKKSQNNSKTKNKKVVTPKTIGEIVDKKINSPEVKKLVGSNEQKAKYLRAFLMNAATKHSDNGNSVEELMNHKSINEKVIPRVCTRIDQFLDVVTQTGLEFSKFEDVKDKKYVTDQNKAMNIKLNSLETQLLENSKMFDSSVENYKADLIKVISDMKKSKHITGLMRDVAELQKGATKSSEQIAIIQEELEKHGYDLEMLGALGLVDMSHDVEKNKRILVDVYNKVQKFEQKLTEHDYDFKMLESLDLVELKNEFAELQEKNGISEEDTKLLIATYITEYINSEEFINVVKKVVSTTDITVTERMTKNARKKLIKELYDALVSEGELDSKKMKSTVEDVVKDIIEHNLTVVKGNKK